MIIVYNHEWLLLSFFTFWKQFMGIPGNAFSITAVYWRKMSQNIGDIHILWAFIWLNELRLKANGCIICSTICFPNVIVMHFVTDCIAQEHMFHVFDWKIKSRAVRKPLPGHQERCLAPRNQSEATNRNDSPAWYMVNCMDTFHFMRFCFYDSQYGFRKYHSTWLTAFE